MAARATVPRSFTTRWMRTLPPETMHICTMVGMPSFRICRQQAPINRNSPRTKRKNSYLRFMYTRLTTALTPWAMTVAMAVPSTPQWKTITKSRSSTMFTTLEMHRKKRVALESPTLRRAPAETL